MTTTWYILTPIDALCLKCPLPWCNEHDPNCPHRLAKAASDGRRRGSVRELQILAYLEDHPDTWFRVCDVIKALPIPRPTVQSVLLRLRREGRIDHVGRGRALRLRAMEGVLT